MRERTENGQVTRYYWDGDQLAAEANIVNGVAILIARYVRGNGLIAREGNKENTNICILAMVMLLN